MISLSGALLLEVIFFSMFLNSRSNMTKEAVADGTYYQAHRLVHFGSDHRIRPASGLTYVRFLSGDVQVTLFAECWRLHLTLISIVLWTLSSKAAI